MQAEISVPHLQGAVSSPLGFNCSKPGGQLCRAAHLEPPRQENFHFHDRKVRLKTKKYPAATGEKAKPRKGASPPSLPGADSGQERLGGAEGDRCKGQGGNSSATRGHRRAATRYHPLPPPVTPGSTAQPRAHGAGHQHPQPGWKTRGGSWCTHPRGPVTLIRASRRRASCGMQQSGSGAP